MNADRRTWMRQAGGLGAASVLGLLGGAAGMLLGDRAQAADYRAVVCLFLSGGNDGNDTLVPLDGAYADYAAGRGTQALARDSLVALPGEQLGHRFGIHPGLAPLATLYDQQRLAWIANIGPLVKPGTAQQFAERAVPLPPFLFSHSDQVAVQQGWLGDVDPSGWGGRALEAMPAAMRHSLAAVTTDNTRTLVLGRRTPISMLDASGFQRFWGPADLLNRGSEWFRATQAIGRAQSVNPYEAEYARTFAGAFDDSVEVAQSLSVAPPPQGDFPAGTLGVQLRTVAQLLPMWKAAGKRRQVIAINWGEFDTHSEQRGSGERSQDTQLAQVGKAMLAFDTAIRAAGLDENVITFVMSDFGRTLKPAAGAGTDHAWGNHWWVIGGPVAGGRAYGRFPTLRLGGPDDFDIRASGRWVPTTATDQFAATLVNWLGVPTDQLVSVLPNLANFAEKTVPFLR